MKKIPTIFMRDKVLRSQVTDEVHPDCLWVFRGEGKPTRKWDGTCCRLDESGRWLGRRELKPGKPTPNYYMEVDVDPVTGKSFGWVPIDQASHYKAFSTIKKLPRAPGTYELCGPKVNGNPEGFQEHVLVLHGDRTVDAPRSGHAEIGEWLKTAGVEGVVWHHPDGRRAKIKARDFGHRRTHSDGLTEAPR